MRGYGLVDSAEGRRASPASIVNLTAVRGADAEGRRRVLSGDLLVLDAQGAGKTVPGTASEFPVGNVKSQAEWLNVVKTNGCFTCHALGNKATRTIPQHVRRHEAGGRLGAAHPVRAGA